MNNRRLDSNAGSLWLRNCIAIATDTPRRVKAATQEGHPAPWLAGDINNTWVRMQHLVGRGNVWTLRNLGVGDLV